MGNKKEMSQQEVTFLCNVNCTPNRLFLLFFGCQSIFMGNSNENGDSPRRISECINDIFSSCSFSHLFKMHLQLFFFSQCLKYQNSHIYLKLNKRFECFKLCQLFIYIFVSCLFAYFGSFQVTSAIYLHFSCFISCLFTF